MLPPTLVDRLVRVLSLRSASGFRLVLLAGAVILLSLAVVVHATTATALRSVAEGAGVFGVGVPAYPLYLGAGLLWLLFALAVWQLRRWVLWRDDNLTLQTARFAASPAEWQSIADPDDPIEQHLRFLGQHLGEARSQRDEARVLAQSLLHLGSHYTVVCTLAGRLLDANAAFVARTGLEVGRTDGAATRRFHDVLTLAPLLDLARRSLREESVLSGISHELVIDGDVRPVDVSMRALHTSTGPVVVMVMGDKTHAATLEHQIDQFTDALELMVDQRVARIASGRASVEDALTDAGIALFVFDTHGVTESVNTVAERLTGRTRFTLTSIDDVAGALAPNDADTFSGWFWGDGDRLVTSVATADGPPRTMAFHRGVEKRGGRAARRVLMGIDAPARAAEGASIETLRRLAEALDAHDLAPAARPYLEVLREAARRLELATPISGDGASAHLGAVVE